MEETSRAPSSKLDVPDIVEEMVPFLNCWLLSVGAMYETEGQLHTWSPHAALELPIYNCIKGSYIININIYQICM